MLKEILEEKSFSGKEFKIKKIQGGSISKKLLGFALDYYVDLVIDKRNPIPPSIMPNEGFVFNQGENIYAYEYKNQLVFKIDISEDNGIFEISAKKVSLK